MLLKRIDETLTQGLYDLDGGPAEVEVYLAEPSIGEGIVNWEVVREGVVPPDFLHYNDAADGSNKLNGSWQGLYVSEAALKEAVIYSGSSIYFSDGSPNFGGVANPRSTCGIPEGLSIGWPGSILLRRKSCAARFRHLKR